MANNYSSTRQNTLLNVLSIQETIGSNYTSNQLLTVLDTALFYAVEAIVRNTNWLDVVLSSVINWYSENTRRKISSTLSKDEVFSKLISILLSEDIDYKIEQLKKLSLERSLWFKTCKIFVSLCPDNTSRFHNFQFLKRESGSLYIAKRDAQYWLNVAIKMKSQIMEKYMRSVGKQALYAKKKNPDINLEDAVQNLTVSLSQAIDKCSSDRGTLTTYISQWFMSAQTKSRGEEYGTAYTIPDTVRKEFYKGRPPNIYVNLDYLVSEGKEDLISDTGADPIEEISSTNLRRHLLLLAKHADPDGYGRFAMGLDEILI